MSSTDLCPNCLAATTALMEISRELRVVDYWRCETCGHVWTTHKDTAVVVHHVTPLRNLHLGR